MGIRTLTTDERDQIQTVVTIANSVLKATKDLLNKELKSNETARTKNYRSLTKAQRDELAHKSADLKTRLGALAPIKGKPVIVVIEAKEICLNYDLLSKFLKSLDKQRFSYDCKITGPPEFQTLTIHYARGSQSGVLELYEESPRTRDLLRGLPRITED